VGAEVTNGAGRTEQWPLVAGYDLLAEVGRGGSAVVYRARHRDLGRIVALKMILAGAHASANVRARFRAEAEAVARLQHPNIVQIFEVGERDGCPYLALEYVAGGTLAQHLQGMPLPARRAGELTETLARTVHHAHENGVVHRDLKPANVLLHMADGGLRIDGESAICNLQSAVLKIADFGLAKYLGADAGRTQTGLILGTPSYMAPEQAAGRGREIGPAADVYALGVILYETLTGRPPFRGESMADTLQQVQFGEPVPPSRFQPRVPRDLQTVCLKCLEKQPGKRYASAQALADDLRRFLAGQPIMARPTPPWERARKWARRSPALAALAGVSAAALLILLVGGGWFTQALRQEAAEARRQRQAAVEQEGKAREQEAIARRERDKARTEAEAARRLVYAADVRRAYQDLYDGHNLGRVLEILNPYDHGPNDPADLRGWEWYHLTSLCHRGLTIYNPKDGAGGLWEVAISPDGRWIAGADTKRGVYVWAARAAFGVWAPDHRLSVPEGSTFAVAFSPDNRLLASSGGGRIILWSTADWKRIGSWMGHDGHVLGLSFSPDRRLLASAGVDGTVKTWRVSDCEAARSPDFNPKAVHALRGHAGEMRGVAFSPDGLQLASAGADATVLCWRTADGELLHTFRGHDRAVNRVAFSPEGVLLASAGEDRTVRLWNLAAGREVRKLEGHSQAVRAVAFRPDGRQLASTGNDSTLRLWDTGTGREISCLMGHWCEDITGVAYMPDGARVLDCSGHPFDASVKAWNTDEATPTWRGFAGQEGDIVSVALDPQATTLATGSTDGGIFVWNVGDRQPRHRLLNQGGLVTAVAFSPDGRLLASATSRTGRLKLWDVLSGRLLRTFPAWTDDVRAVVFSPDGRVLAAAGKGMGPPRKDWDCPIKLWEVETGKEVRTFLGHKASVNGLAFNKDGSWLVSAGSDGTVRQWFLADGAQRLVLDQPQQAVYALALHPDGRHLATVHPANVTADSWEVRVWDLETAHRTHVLRQHDKALTGLAYSPDGRRLFTVSLDRTLKIWDTVNGQEILSLRGYDRSILDVACSADGRSVVTVGQAGEVRLWDAPMIQGRRWSGLDVPRAPEQLLAWHRREAAAAEAEGQWYAAAWHLERLLAHEPDSATLRARRDHARHQAGR
jgi:WD40 repeat protein